MVSSEQRGQKTEKANSGNTINLSNSSRTPTRPPKRKPKIAQNIHSNKNIKIIPFVMRKILVKLEMYAHKEIT